jgi:putative membrane protein
MSHFSPRTWSERLYLLFTGLCMGAADVVPGVSGGTMAFIMGVYEDLIEAIKSVDTPLIGKVLRFKFKEVFEQFPWQFLLFLIGGIVLAVGLLAGPLHSAYEHHRTELYAFFFGLVLASILLLARDVPWNIRRIFSLLLGTMVGYVAVTIAPVEQMPSTFLFHALCGAIAITAMILPGISGSFLLLILGKYDTAIGAVKSLDLLTLAPFALGAVVGILTFSRLLSWLLHRYHHSMVAALIGFMIGSLRKLYPWKDVLEVITKPDGEQVPVRDQMMWPSLQTDTLPALGLIVLGVLVILGIEAIRRRTLLAEVSAASAS